jgi:bifunctional non-homologous end joining protein LigD
LIFRVTKFIFSADGRPSGSSRSLFSRADGIANFDRLRAALAAGSFPVRLRPGRFDGADLRPRPWTGRREALVHLLAKPNDAVVLSEHVEGEHGSAIYQAACQMGLEGIVSKRLERPYRLAIERGRRTC